MGISEFLPTINYWKFVNLFSEITNNFWKMLIEISIIIKIYNIEFNE